MDRYKRPFDKGNLVIQFSIKFPPSNWISDPIQFQQLESLLPPRDATPAYNEKEVEEVVLSNFDPSPSSSNAYTDHMDEDDDHHGHGPGVQCAQQ